MSLKLSLEEILQNLERQIAFHREQASLHGREEELHRDRRVAHEAELETATRRLEMLRTVAVPASEMALPPDAASKAAAAKDADTDPTPSLADLIAQILESRSADEAFGAKAMAAEINQSFRKHLSKEADIRSVSAALRRMHRRGHLQLVRKGRAVQEALYAKGPGMRGS
jgi:hypothetical protein